MGKATEGAKAKPVSAARGPFIEPARIMEMIPHRAPFLLLDRVIEFSANEYAVGLKNVTINEPQFSGHFPSAPVMPGVLIIESMAQTTAAFVVNTLGAEAEGKLVYFMSIERARFRKPVIPGDTMLIRAEKLANRGDVWKSACTVTVDGVLVAEATISAMIRERAR